MIDIVVTGVGVVSPLGVGRRHVTEALLNGECGIGPLSRFDEPGLASRLAGQVDCAALPEVGRRGRPLDRFVRFALVAAHEALDDAGLSTHLIDPDRTGVVVGTAYGAIERVEETVLALHRSGSRAVPPAFSVLAGPTVPAASISVDLGLRGPIESTSAACSSGARAVVRGAEFIRAGEADIVLAGGADAAITPLCMVGFAAARALSRRNDAPERAVRPFDVDRDGFVFAEGAAVLVLEGADSARRRGVPVLAHLVGSGSASDGHSLAAPDPEGRGAERAMCAALRAAGATPSEVGYVNAHAAGTPIGDRAEWLAMLRVFGPDGPAVSSTKGATGHLMGAAGALEAAVAVEAVASGAIPPTLNADVLDDGCDLDVVVDKPRRGRVDLAMSNSFGLGGINCSLLFAGA